jgi:hypothetical protein
MNADSPMGLFSRHHTRRVRQIGSLAGAPRPAAARRGQTCGGSRWTSGRSTGRTGCLVVALADPGRGRDAIAAEAVT